MAVAVVRVEESVKAAVREAMELADWRSYIPAGSRVALKPNLCWDLPLPGAQTSPWVFEAVIEILKDQVAEIVVVEANQVTVDGDAALERTGIGRVVTKHGLEFVNMSRGTFHRVDLPDGFVLKHLEVPDVLSGRVLVTLPVLKTHGSAFITGALKNQWGCLKELRHNYHLVLDDAIADLNDALRPAFAVMDGTVGLEGSGPKTGTPRVADLVLASSDLPAMDTVAAKIMGFDPAKAGHIGRAAERGLGQADIDTIEVRGIDISGLDLDFEPPKQNFMVKTEFFLRKSFLKNLMFETGILSLLAWMAKVWNWWWWKRVGAKERDRIIEMTRYGRQWRGESEGDVS